MSAGRRRCRLCVLADRHCGNRRYIYTHADTIGEPGSDHYAYRSASRNDHDHTLADATAHADARRYTIDSFLHLSSSDDRLRGR
jgi:hypothetical protein